MLHYLRVARNNSRSTIVNELPYPTWIGGTRRMQITYKIDSESCPLRQKCLYRIGDPKGQVLVESNFQ